MLDQLSGLLVYQKSILEMRTNPSRMVECSRFTKSKAKET
jgi:hypothetical protein